MPLARRERPRTLVALAVLSVVASAILIATNSLANWIPFLCPEAHGGHPGAQVQLQYLHVSNQSVTFSFVNSVVTGGFDVPEYTVGRTDDSSIAVSFRGASIYQPDGTRSYTGPLVVEPGRQIIRRVSLSADADRTNRWQVKLERWACPRVAEMRYWTGSYSRAQVIVTFGGASTVTLEPAVRPVAAPIWVNGAGFASSTRVVLTVGDQTVRETTTDGAGTFQTAIYVPEVNPGIYLVVARDGAGHNGQATLIVTDGHWP